MTNRLNRGKVRDWPAYLRAFRSKHDLTQERLALLLSNIAVRTVEGWEQAEFTPPPYLKLALVHIATKLQREKDRYHAPAKRE